MNISICIWGLKSALLVKNAWFHNSSMITILTHSNKGSPLQLHQSGVIWKGEHADLAFCFQATSPISLSCWFRVIAQSCLQMCYLWQFVNITWVENCSRLIPFVLACVVRAKTGGDGEGRGIEMAVEVNGPPISTRWWVYASSLPRGPCGHDLPSIPLRSHSFHFHKHQ